MLVFTSYSVAKTTNKTITRLIYFSLGSLSTISSLCYIGLVMLLLVLSVVMEKFAVTLFKVIAAVLEFAKSFLILAHWLLMLLLLAWTSLHASSLKVILLKTRSHNSLLLATRRCRVILRLIWSVIWARRINEFAIYISASSWSWNEPTLPIRISLKSTSSLPTPTTAATSVASCLLKLIIILGLWLAHCAHAHHLWRLLTLWWLLSKLGLLLLKAWLHFRINI